MSSSRKSSILPPSSHPRIDDPPSLATNDTDRSTVRRALQPASKRKGKSRQLPRRPVSTQAEHEREDKFTTPTQDIVSRRSKEADYTLTQRCSIFMWAGTCGVANFVLRVLLDALRLTFILLRTPIALIVVLLLVATLLRYSYEAFLRSVVVPICNLPLVSLALPFCTTVSSWPGATPIPDYPKLLQLQSGFEDLLESSSGSSLALDIKKSEIAIRDLSTLVKTSDLVCKEALAEKLEEFVGEARDVGRGLQRLGSRVGGAVDIILAVDEYALRSLEAIAPKQISAGETKDLSSFAGMLLGRFFGGASLSTARAQRALLIRTFNLAAQEMQSQLGRLIIEAEASLILLDRLEQMLSTIHEIVILHDMDTQTKREEVLAKLWTKLGGNRGKLWVFASHLNLLANVSQYRRTALLRVSATMLQLRQLSADLDDLRDRVAAPSLVGEQEDESGIPIEVHIESIRKGVERLGEYRKRTMERENAYLKDR